MGDPKTDSAKPDVPKTDGVLSEAELDDVVGGLSRTRTSDDGLKRGQASASLVGDIDIEGGLAR